MYMIIILISKSIILAISKSKWLITSAKDVGILISIVMAKALFGGLDEMRDHIEEFCSCNLKTVKERMDYLIMNLGHDAMTNISKKSYVLEAKRHELIRNG